MGFGPNGSSGTGASSAAAATGRISPPRRVFRYQGYGDFRPPPDAKVDKIGSVSSQQVITPLPRRVFRYQGNADFWFIPAPVATGVAPGWEEIPIPRPGRRPRQPEQLDPLIQFIFPTLPEGWQEYALPPPRKRRYPQDEQAWPVFPAAPFLVPWGWDEDILVISAGKGITWEEGDVPAPPTTAPASTAGSPTVSQPKTLSVRVFRFQGYAEGIFIPPSVASGLPEGWQNYDLPRRPPLLRRLPDSFDQLFIQPPAVAMGVNPGWESYDLPVRRKFFRFPDQQEVFLYPTAPVMVTGWEEYQIPRGKAHWLFRDPHELWHLNIPIPPQLPNGWEDYTIPRRRVSWLFREEQVWPVGAYPRAKSAAEVVTANYFFVLKGMNFLAPQLLPVTDLEYRVAVYSPSSDLSTLPTDLATIGGPPLLAYFHNLDAQAIITIQDSAGNTQLVLKPGASQFLIQTLAKKLPASWVAFADQGTPNLEYGIWP